MEGRNYEIITDTCSNLSEKQAEKYNIKIMGFPYIVNEKEVTDYPPNNTFEAKEAYALLRKKAEVKTSLINSFTIEEFAEMFLKAKKDVIYITISGGISGTYHNACVAAETLREKYPERKIFVIDSLSGSYAQGILVVKTAKKRENGASVEEAAEYAGKLRYYITHDFTIDNLIYLKKSGRVSNSAALIGTIARIKPMFTLSGDGKLVVSEKVNGRKKSLALILENFKKNIDYENADFIGIVHGDCKEEAEELRKKVCSFIPKAEIFFDYLTPLVGSHTGPGAIGLLYVSKNKRVVLA